MSTGAKTPLKEAGDIAEALRGLLLESCIQIEIAGSIRREKAEVGDGEIVAVPRIEGYRNHLHDRLEELLKEGLIQKAVITDKNSKQSNRWGDKYRAIVFGDIKFDIFMTDTASWGYQLLLRTGPAEANEYLVTRVKNSPAPFLLKGGDVFKGDVRLTIDTEEDMFSLCGLPFIDPPKRTEEAYKKLLGRGHKWGTPRAFIPQQIRLLWKYEQETLDAYPIPLEFRDEASGMTWANLSTDRFGGEYVLVEKGSHEERFQHEFLVGITQRRFELNRLRKLLWWGEEIDVPGVVDISDLPDTYFTYLPGSHVRESVPLSKIVPTQAKVYKWGVYVNVETIERQRAGLFAMPWKPCSGIRFADSDQVFLTDGHHRFMCAQQYTVPALDVDVVAFNVTLDEAREAVEVDDTNYDFLADVLEEAMSILAEAKVLA